MISASISAAAAMRKLGFWTNFGIMARDAPPRPIMPTPKTRSLAAICSLLSRNDCLTLYVFDDYPSSKKLSRSARVPRAGDGYTLVAGRLADLYSTLVQCSKCSSRSKRFRILPNGERFERSGAMERLERLEPGIR